MTFKPIRDRILVRPEEQETKTAGGIYIPDNAQEKPMKGTVIKVGTGKVAEDGSIVPMAVKDGDVVVYGKFTGTEVKVENVNHVILNEDDVIAIVE